MSGSNEQWARKIIRSLDPSFQPRWEVFDEYVDELADSSKRCLNIGSGLVEDPEFQFDFRLCVDTDILFPGDTSRRKRSFVQSDVSQLPFATGSIDVVLMRFVVEHLRDPYQAFREIRRILSGRGRIIIITTNVISPMIWLGRLLPYGLRKWLMTKIYGVTEDDVFPTYHRLNTFDAVKRLAPQFKIIRWQYLQDANWNRRWLFLLLFVYHLKTKWLGLKSLRSNFITVLEKTNVS